MKHLDEHENVNFTPTQLEIGTFYKYIGINDRTMILSAAYTKFEI